ncbi:protein PSK SIMULATOR [Trifolium repens]|nr:protein PSK SIMULATOR [Trifolium repens]
MIKKTKFTRDFKRVVVVEKRRKGVSVVNGFMIWSRKIMKIRWTVIGIKCKDGIVLGVENLIPSKMMLPGSNRRIHVVHQHSGMVDRNYTTSYMLWIDLHKIISINVTRRTIQMQLIVVQVLNGVPPTEDYSLAKYNKVNVDSVFTFMLIQLFL